MKRLNKSIVSITDVPTSFGYLMKSRWLWKYILTPLILNILLFFSVWLGSFKAATYLLSRYTRIEEWAYNLDLISYFIVFIVVAIIAGFLTFILATTVAAPFNGMMVVKILQKEGLAKDRPMGLKVFIGQIIRSLEFEVLKIFLLVLILIIGYILGVVPFLGAILASLIAFFGNAFLQTLDFFDAIMEEYDFGVVQKFSYLWKNADINIGLLIITGFVVLVPFLSLFYIPIGVLTATRSFIKNA